MITLGNNEGAGSHVRGKDSDVIPSAVTEEYQLVYNSG